jgi:opacity protein-like surface antigen
MTIRHLAASAVALAAFAAPAAAGDWNNGDGSLKDQRGRSAVAVPAPMPVPETGPGWYMRGDFGVGRSSRSMGESGLSFGGPGDADDGRMYSPSWMTDGGKSLFNYSAGVGYHWSKSFRTDLTLERRATETRKATGHYQYQKFLPPVAGEVTPITIHGSTYDDVDIRSGALLLNGYYDFAKRHGFTPYIGLGMGAALSSTSRSTSATTEWCETGTDGAMCNDRGSHFVSRSGSSKTSDNFSFAAAATAGFAYSLTANTAVDLSYRFLYVAGHNVQNQVYGQSSKLSLGDLGEHQLRAGLRWDIN